MSSFPLLRLPRESIIQVIRGLAIIDILIFSFASKATKSIVKATGIKARSASFKACTDLSITYQFDPNGGSIEFYQESNKIVATRRFTLSWVHISSESRNVQIEMKTFIMHCMEIFNFYRIDNLLVFPNHFDLEFIKHVLEGSEIRRLEIPELMFAENGHKIMETFKYTSLSISHTTQAYLPSILVQNLDVLMIENVHFLKLHHLLSTNCSEMKINQTDLMEQDLNKFIKLWIKGSNPRLKFLILGGEGVFNENGVLKGIRYTKMTEMRTFYRLKDSGNVRSLKIPDGYDISSSGGVKATIRIVGSRILMVVLSRCQPDRLSSRPLSTSKDNE